MTKRALLIVLVALAARGLLGLPRANAAPPQQVERPLRVVTKPLEPFVIKQNDRWTGFSIELWDKIAEQLNLKYEWVEVKTVDDQLDAIERGDADVAIAGISLTPEREQRVDFSYPYFNAGLQILISAQGRQSLLDIAGTFAPTLLKYLGIGLLIAVALAHAIWLVERRHNPDFRRGYFAGVWEGVWWLLNIIANGEYGDKQTRSIVKRLMTMGVWLFGVVLIAQFTASVTSALTVRQLTGAINGPADLPGREIATVRGTTAAQYLTNAHVRFVEVSRIDDAYQLLAQERVQAVVYDAPVLLYYAATRGKGFVQVAGPIFKEESYGIALPTGSPYRKPINEALLRLKQDGTYDEIYSKWFGDGVK